MSSEKMTYKDVGVDIDLADGTTNRIKELVRGTFNRRVLSEVGSFGSFFAADFKEFKKPVLISSADGVGTKLKVAFEAGVHDTVGEDLVNHCVGDIAVHGAQPLYFLDYFATGKLDAETVTSVISGLARGCRNNGCALIGGETAEMPGFYSQGEYDLAGFIVGVVDRSKIIDGRKIKAGDVIIGMPSNGLHTNGYSLVRALFFDRLRWQTTRRVPELGCELAAELLRVHRSYLNPVQALIRNLTVKGLAHITGGGIPGNLVRILPNGCQAEIDTTTWDRPAIFDLIQKLGRVDTDEMYRAFNMGLGMLAVVGPRSAGKALQVLQAQEIEARVIGEIKSGNCEVRLH